IEDILKDLAAGKIPAYGRPDPAGRPVPSPEAPPPQPVPEVNVVELMKKLAEAQDYGRNPDRRQGRALKDLAQGSWEEYGARVAELAGPIRDIAAKITGILDRQVQETEIPQGRTMIPGSDPVGRLDRNAWQKLKENQQAGNADISARKIFIEDVQDVVRAPPEFVICIDGSGSMNGKLSSGSTPMATAYQCAVILSEAAAKAGAVVWVMMFGDNDPRILLYPGKNRQQAGKDLETTRKGIHS
ncbi:MAG: VWA domain-containing protein, partial [Pseudomonadota bacterium]|nr:VWA domain-containing protein [Pseudomonadota bacterium]